MPDRSRCPNCGERVSPYAAGCAVCGADLDHRRWDTGPSAANRAGSWLSALTYGGTQSRIHPVLLWILILCAVSLMGSAVAYISGVL
jgi:hypothetical protein